MPKLTCNLALLPYLAAFKEPARPFLCHYRLDARKRLVQRRFSRGEFWRWVTRAASVLKSHGMGRGCTQVHFFSGNHPLDLVFRLAATLVGSVPVTVNWQADSQERVLYKIRLTGAGLLVHDGGLHPAFLKGMRESLPTLPLFRVGDLGNWESLDGEAIGDLDLSRNDSKIIIFTSGTTGQPKGVLHAYRSYDTNTKTFDSFLGLEGETPFQAVVVNPLHHANATAITDWCLRKPGATLHLIERYTTDFWRVLAEIGTAARERVIVPAVARHFDFLEQLESSDQLPLPLDSFVQSMNRVEFLLGSAPVGPATVRRLERYTGKLPLVRFGSTETCLQVLGTAPALSPELRGKAFRRGWNHGEGNRPGYYIGRPHEPYTEVRLVASIQPGDADFLLPVREGVPGYFITRGENLMAGYVKQPEATAAVLQDGWYTGLADIGFYLNNEEDGQPDYYWMSRESSMLIRGGANYSYDQINEEIRRLLKEKLGLVREDLDVAIVGLRLNSEHEDSGCLTVELKSPNARDRESAIFQLLTETEGREALSKAARPEYVRFGPVPRNFKGAVSIPDLKQMVESWLEENREDQSREG